MGEKLPRYWRYIDAGLILAFALMIFSLILFGYYLFSISELGEVGIAFASLVVGIVAIFIATVLSVLTSRSIKAEIK